MYMMLLVYLNRLMGNFVRLSDKSVNNYAEQRSRPLIASVRHFDSNVTTCFDKLHVHCTCIMIIMLSLYLCMHN